MPNIPETAVAMLATASIGGVWAVCSPDLGIGAVVDRFAQLEPTVLIELGLATELLTSLTASRRA